MMVGTSYPATLSRRMARSCRALAASSAVKPTSPSRSMSIPVALSVRLIPVSARLVKDSRALLKPSASSAPLRALLKPSASSRALLKLSGPPLVSCFLPWMGGSWVMASLGWPRLSICAAFFAPGL